MIINNLEIFFDRQEGDNFVFKNNLDQEILIDKKILYDWDPEDKKLFLSVDGQAITTKPQDFLNEILETEDK